MQHLRPRRVLSLLVFAASASALIATSKSPISEYTSESVELDFTLEGGESRSYQVNITHADRGDSGGLSLFVSASVTAVDNDTTLDITLSEPTSTDTMVTGAVDTDGLTVTAYGDYSLNTTPSIMLTAGKEGGAQGTLSVDVGVEWYSDTLSDTAIPLTVELVEVDVETEETEETEDAGDSGQ